MGGRERGIGILKARMVRGQHTEAPQGARQKGQVLPVPVETGVCEVELVKGQQEVAEEREVRQKGGLLGLFYLFIYVRVVGMTRRSGSRAVWLLDSHATNNVFWALSPIRRSGCA
jgi:hypothetical protein